MKINKWLIVLILLSVIGTAIVYPYVPEMVPGHWNFKGEIDRYQSKGFLFLTAILPLGLYLLMFFLPKIDPKKAAYLKHERAYKIFQIFITLFLIAIHWITVAVALGYSLNVGILVRLGMGFLFIVTGNYMSQIRQNYFFGIKNPWTLANEQVWKKTHRIGGYAFILSGIIAVFTIFLRDSIAFIALMLGLFIPLIYTNVYSYFLYKRITKEE
ncbi:SdpI family protein [Thermotalea metallivorans]|uniref:Immunity protein SdpI n=1 Tax=Thermotalea metallivorans TaxID=520762 RepID=A0A140KZZ7_9FIRM|nr:SdpI family protein [Thermotalea metallivorans]KXG73872.1 Immunity protein SdpI [Thermotalea metallivorans]